MLGLGRCRNDCENLPKCWPPLFSLAEDKWLCLVVRILGLFTLLPSALYQTLLDSAKATRALCLSPREQTPSRRSCSCDAPVSAPVEGSCAACCDSCIIDCLLSLPLFGGKEGGGLPKSSEHNEIRIAGNLGVMVCKL